MGESEKHKTLLIGSYQSVYIRSEKYEVSEQYFQIFKYLEP